MTSNEEPSEYYETLKMIENEKAGSDGARSIVV